MWQNLTSFSILLFCLGFYIGFPLHSASQQASSSSHPPSSMPLADVLIIGGGPAGLATATSLARQLYTAVVFDSGTYRNARAAHMHNLPGWDHVNPAAFRAKCRADLLARYDTVRFEDGARIVEVQRAKHGFVAVDQRGQTWAGRKVVLATGVTDVFPNIPGYADCWGYGIFACLFCHGYEERSLPSSGILAVGPTANPATAVHLSYMARRITERLTFYTDGDEALAKQLEAQLADDKDARSGRIRFDSRKIERLERGPGAESEVVLTMKGGDQVTEGFLSHQPPTVPNGPFAQQLALELNQPSGEIKTTYPFQETSSRGVFAVGDCASPLKAVAMAIVSGATAAAGISFQLGPELAKAEESG